MNHVTHRCTYVSSAREKRRVDVAHFPHGDAKLRVLLHRGMERSLPADVVYESHTIAR